MATSGAAPGPPGAAVKLADLKPGSYVDVLDTIGQWMEAVVVEKDRDAVFLHYTWWTCQWDEWVKVPSDRLAPHGTKVYLPGGVLRVGQVIEVFDDHPTINKWSEGSVVEESPDQVKVHFKGFVAKFDKWFPRNSPYLSPFGVHRRLRHPHIRRVPRILIEAQLTSFHGALAKKDMRVVRCDPDGNCLFRAASHQIYGTEAHHALVRERTLDYMEVWKTHFSAFTVGNLDLFPEYVKWKRANAVWGDEPEVQAISELYGRPVEVFAFHPVDGAVIINRCDHSDKRQPIRFSFYGGGHYDSIVGPGFAENLVKDPPDTVERRALDMARIQTDPSAYERAVAESEHLASEEATMAAVLQESRRLYSRGFEASLEGLMSGSPVAAPGPDDGTGSAVGAAPGVRSDAPAAAPGARAGAGAPSTGAAPAPAPAPASAEETPADIEARLLRAAQAESERLAREKEQEDIRRAQQASEAAAFGTMDDEVLAASLAAAEEADRLEMLRAVEMSFKQQ